MQLSMTPPDGSYTVDIQTQISVTSRGVRPPLTGDVLERITAEIEALVRQLLEEATPCDTP